MTATVKPGVVIIEGHVQGLANTRALGEVGVPVVVVDERNCLARYSKYCKKFFRCPDYNSENFITFLIGLVENENLNGWMLLPSNDHAVYNISKNRTRLNAHYKLVTPGIDTIERIYNKGKLIDLARKLNVPVPNTFYPVASNNPPTELKYPVITKGIFGLSFYKKMGRKAFLADNAEELCDQYFQIERNISVNEVFTQELIPSDGTNKTISFTCFCDHGEIKTSWMGIKIREHPIQFGTATYCRSIYIEELLSPSDRLMHELNYTGVCEIEYLLDPRDKVYKLIEINARTWLWVELAKNCGINYPVILYNYVNGIENFYQKEYDLEKHWMHYTTDIPYSISGILKRKNSLTNVLRSYLSFPSPAVLNWKDPLPSFAEFFLLPYFILHR